MLVKQDVLKRKDSFFFSIQFPHIDFVSVIRPMCHNFPPFFCELTLQMEGSCRSLREEPAGKVGLSQGKSALEKKALLC